MGNDKRNRNALRSQRLLQQAFSELLNEKPFDKITVTDITQRADLSRGTFYAHYDNTSDLLKSLLDEIMDKMFSVVDVATATNFLTNPEPVIKLVTDYLLEDESLFRTLIGTPAADAFVTQVKGAVIERLLDRIELDESVCDALQLRIGTTYLVGGLIDLCCSWLRGDFGDVGIDELAVASARLVKSAKDAVMSSS